MWWIVVATGELLPGNSSAMRLISETAVNDKVLHGCAYAVLAFVPAIGLRWQLAVVAVVLAELGGIGLELAQRWVPGRSCDFYDVLANTAGLACGSSIAWLFIRLAARFDENR